MSTNVVETGAVSSRSSAVAETEAGSPRIGLNTPRGFSINDHVVVFGAGAAHDLTTPPTPTLTVIGQAGSRTREYKIVAVSRDLGWTAASPAATLTTVPDVIDADSWVKVAIPQPQAEVYQYAVYARGGGSDVWHILGSVYSPLLGGVTQVFFSDYFDDYSAAAPDGPAGVPRGTLPATTPPTSKQNDMLRSVVVSADGAAITLADAAHATVHGGLVEHCNLTPFREALAAGGLVTVPAGTYRIWGNLEIEERVHLLGDCTDNTVLEFGIGYGMVVRAGRGGQPSTVEQLTLNTRAQTLSAGSMLVAPPVIEGGADEGRVYGHAVLILTECTFAHVTVRGFRGSGFLVYGDKKDDTNANRARLIACRSASNRGHGFGFTGGDANGGYVAGCNATNADDFGAGHNGIGFFDASYLGNTFVACHTNSSGLAYVARDATCFATFIGCFAEDRGGGSIIHQSAALLGGDNYGPGFSEDSNGLVFDTRNRVSPHVIASGPKRDYEFELGDMIGRPEEEEEEEEEDNRGRQLLRWTHPEGRTKPLHHKAIWSPAANRIAFSWVGARETAFNWNGPVARGPGLLHLPTGFLVGDPSSRTRRIGCSYGAPSDDGLYDQGDLFFDLRGNEYFYRVAKKGGMAQAGWRADTIYAVGDVIEEGDQYWYVAAVAGLPEGADDIAKSARGTSGSTRPTWPSSGAVVDNEVTWRLWARGAAEFEVFGRRTRVLSVSLRSIGAHSTAESPDIAIPGAQVGDSVSATPQEAPPEGIMWAAYIPTEDRVRLRLANVTANSLPLLRVVWKFEVFRE